MKGMRVGLFACMAILAVFFVAGWTLAGEGKAGKGGKGGKGGAAKETVKAAPKIRNDQGQKTPLENRLKQLQFALEGYAAAHAHLLPANINGLVNLLENGEKDLVNPETDKPVEMNPAMSAQTDDRIANPSAFATFWADQPTAGKGRAVIFANKAIKFLSEDEFTKVKAASVFPPMTKGDREARRDAKEARREAKQK